MDKTAIIILGVLLFYLLMGLCLAIFPEGTNRARNALLRSVRIISKQQARQSLSDKERIKSRIFGTIFVVGSVFVLTQMTWQFGKLPENTLPMRSTNNFAEDSKDAALHEIVAQIVGPMAQKHVGLMVVTIADEARDISGFGRVNLDSDSSPPDAETIFELGSLSKVFTGILLAESINRADLSLQATAASLLPELADLPDAQAASITLEHLATHTSGLPRMPAGAFRPSAFWNAFIAGDSYQHYTEADLLTVLAKKTSRSAPGERLRYSNAGFGLLGHILSQRYGLEYQALIKTMIAEPLGMKDTGVTLDNEQEARFAAGYRGYFHIGAYYLGQRSAHWNFPNCVAGAGGLRSTANDMLAFLAANMGRMTSEITPALRRSHEILFSGDAVQIGMAWFHKTLPTSGESIIWHNGETGGFSSFLGFSANGRVGVCVLNNSARSVDHIGEAILESLLVPRP